MIKFFVVLGLAVLVITANGTSDEVQQVSEVYVVKPGDTVWSIAEENLPEGKYILQFQHEIVEANPELKTKGYVLHPGDKLVINRIVRRVEHESLR